METNILKEIFAVKQSGSDTLKQKFGRKRKTEDKKLKFKGSECVFFY